MSLRHPVHPTWICTLCVRTLYSTSVINVFAVYLLCDCCAFGHYIRLSVTCVLLCVCCVILCVCCVFAVCLLCVCCVFAVWFCVFAYYIRLSIICVFAACLLWICTAHLLCVGALHLRWLHVCLLCFGCAFALCLHTTGWRRLIGSLMLIGHFPRKWPIFSGSFAENDHQLRGPYESSPPCTSDAVCTCMFACVHLLGCMWSWVCVPLCMCVCHGACTCAWADTCACVVACLFACVITRLCECAFVFVWVGVHGGVWEINDMEWLRWIFMFVCMCSMNGCVYVGVRVCMCICVSEEERVRVPKNSRGRSPRHLKSPVREMTHLCTTKSLGDHIRKTATHS